MHFNSLIKSSLIIMFLYGCSAATTPTMPIAKDTPALEATTIPIMITETLPPKNTAIPDGFVLYSEDFEDGSADGLTYTGTNWQVITDKDGNHVYEVNTLENNDGASFDLGSSKWTNYAVKYRVKFLNANSDIWLNLRNSKDGLYIYRLSSEFHHVSIYTSLKGAPWEEVKSLEYSFERENWYMVQAEVQGNHITAYINDTLVLKIDDDQFSYGDIAFGNLGDTHAYYDDILVTALGE